MKKNTGRLAAFLTAVMIVLPLGGCGAADIGEIQPNAPAADTTVPEVTQNEAQAADPAAAAAPAENAPAEKPAEQPGSPDESKEPRESKDVPAADPNRPTSGTATVHLLCAGDNLIHDNIYVEAEQLGGGKYDFHSMYEEVKPYVQKADIAILNQETLVNDKFEAATYPTFSTPTEDGDAVVDLGFNVISMSNNHVLDRGSEGLIASLDYWDTKDVVHYGAYRDTEDSENIRTKTVNGVTFAFLGYMEHTNGFFLDDDEPGQVVYLDEDVTIKQQIERAKEIADVVVVSCHFGTEVEHEINAQQQTMAPELADWGADLIIGTQAHCVSTCGYVTGENGHRAFCYYGLGNFFHTMYDRHSAVGIFGDLDITYDFATDEVTFENIKAIPTISHFEADSFDSMWYNCKVYPLATYTDEMFARNFNDGITREQAMECLDCIPSTYLSIE